MIKPNHRIKLNTKLLFIFIIFLFPQVAFAYNVIKAESKEEAIQHINDQKDAGQFPISIKAFDNNDIPLPVYLMIRFVPFPQNSNFEFKYIVFATKEEYDQAKIDNEDYFLIYESAPNNFQGLGFGGYRAIWVKNEIVVHDFDNATVYEYPYSISSYDLADRLAGHVLSFGIGEVLSDLTKNFLKVSFNWVTYLHTAYSLFWEILDYNNPVSVIPLTSQVELDGEEYTGKGACEGSNISGMIFLDLVRQGTYDVDPGKLDDLQLSSKYWALDNNQDSYAKQKDQQVVLTKDEIRTLPGERSYQIIPKTPLDAPSTTDPDFKQAYDFFRLDGTTREDGHIFAYTSNSKVFFNEYYCTNILIAAGSDSTIGLKYDGTVVVAGLLSYLDVTELRDIQQVDVDRLHVVGLKSDGTVVAIGPNIEKSDHLNVTQWSDIQQVVAGDHSTFGLKSDGTVVAVGYDEEEYGILDVTQWSDIKQIADGAFFTVGLKSDGTVVVAGWENELDVTQWSDIQQIAAGSFHTVGLKSDGTVVSDDLWYKLETTAWSDIQQVAAGFDHTGWPKV